MDAVAPLINPKAKRLSDEDIRRALSELQNTTREVIELEKNEDLSLVRGMRRGMNAVRGYGSDYEKHEWNGENWVQIYP